MLSNFDEVERQVVPGVLRGYREWRLEPSGLYAVNFPYLWWTGVNEAIHWYGGLGPVSTCHAPMRGCSCGFYALHEPFTEQYGTFVRGTIRAHGRIILGDFGFKAQYVEIESIAVMPSYGSWFTGISSLLSSHYPGVPIFDSYQELIKNFPPISVRELLGPAPKPEPFLFGEINVAFPMTDSMKRFIEEFSKEEPE